MATVTHLWPLAVALLLALLPALAGAGEEDLDAPPLVGQGPNFSGAVGSYTISYRAAPTELAVEDPLLLTVRITGTGPEKYHPRRDRLDVLLTDLKDDFYIEPAPKHDRRLAAENAWEFAWRLRPKHAGESHLPSLQLRYYDPAQKRFRSTRTRQTIVLQVTPRPEAPLKGGPVEALQAPERFFTVVTGPAVLRRDRGDLPPWLLLMLVAGPPLLCAAWYVVWRRLHPDADRRRRRLANRAAREALAALERLGPHPTGERTAATLAEYLRHRLDLRAAEPTPAEVAAHLEHAGLSAALTRRAADLFRACDAARFAPAHAAPAALSASAAELVHALEAELCAPDR